MFALLFVFVLFLNGHQVDVDRGLFTPHVGTGTCLYVEVNRIMVTKTSDFFQPSVEIFLLYRRARFES
jgi:hypothetical protein